PAAPRATVSFRVTPGFDAGPLAGLPDSGFKFAEDGEDLQHGLAEGRADVHGLAEAEEGDTPCLKLADDVQEGHGVAADAVHGVADELVAGAEVGHQLLPAGPVERQARVPLVGVPLDGFVLALQPLVQFVLLRGEVLVVVRASAVDPDHSTP